MRIFAIVRDIITITFPALGRILPRQQHLPRTSGTSTGFSISKQYMDQSKLATWHVWCGTNIGHILVWNKCRTFLVRNKFRTFLVRNKYRTFLCALVGSSIRYLWGGLRIGSAAPRLPHQHHVRPLSPHMRNAGCPLGRGRIPSSFNEVTTPQRHLRTFRHRRGFPTIPGTSTSTSIPYSMSFRIRYELPHKIL